MWVSITYSFSFCYCFIFLIRSELFCSDYFFTWKIQDSTHLKNTLLEIKESFQFTSEKNTEMVFFWMESKFLQHSWRQLVCCKELSTQPQCFLYAPILLKQPLLFNTSTFPQILSSGQLENLNTSFQSGQYFCTQENLNTKWFWHRIQ